MYVRSRVYVGCQAFGDYVSSDLQAAEDLIEGCRDEASVDVTGWPLIRGSEGHRRRCGHGARSGDSGGMVIKNIGPGNSLSAAAAAA